MLVAGYLKKVRRSLEKRRTANILRYLVSKDVRIYKRVDGITLVQYPDHIGKTLLEGKLWRLEAFEAALATLQPCLRKGVFIDFGANTGMHSIYAARTNLFTKIVEIRHE